MAKRKKKVDLIGNANPGSNGISHKNKLYEVLKRKFRHDPRFVKDGRLRCPQIAHVLGMTNEGFYRWLRSDRLPYSGMHHLLKCFPDYLREWDLLSFVPPQRYNPRPESADADDSTAPAEDLVHDLI